MIEFLKKYERYIGWTLKGTFLIVYLKWVIIGCLLSGSLVLSLSYPLFDWKLMKLEFFIVLYVSLIPALMSRNLKK